MSENQPRDKRRPLIAHRHRKRPLLTWIVPLGIIIAIMILLPKLVDLLTR